MVTVTVEPEDSPNDSDSDPDSEHSDHDPEEDSANDSQTDPESERTDSDHEPQHGSESSSTSSLWEIVADSGDECARLHVLYSLLTFLTDRCLVRMKSLLTKGMNESKLDFYDLERYIFLVGVLPGACSSPERPLTVIDTVEEWIGKWLKSDCFQQFDPDERIGGSLMTAMETANVIFSNEEWFNQAKQMSESKDLVPTQSDTSRTKRQLRTRPARRVKITASVVVEDWYVTLIQLLNQNSMDDLFGGINQCPSEWKKRSQIPTIPYCKDCEIHCEMKSKCTNCDNQHLDRVIDYKSLTALHVVSMIIYHFYQSHAQRNHRKPGPVETLLAFSQGRQSGSGSGESDAAGPGPAQSAAIDPGLLYVFNLSDASYRVNDLLRLVQFVRPYKSLGELRREAFEQQCYYVTHVIFSYTDWGRQPSLLQSKYKLDFQPELDFLLRNMDVVVNQMRDVELVAEFVSCLCILRKVVTEQRKKTELRNVAMDGMRWVMRQECEKKNQSAPLAIWPCCLAATLDKELHVLYTVVMAASLLRDTIEWKLFEIGSPIYYVR